MNFRTTAILVVLAAAGAALWLISGELTPAGDSGEKPKRETTYVLDPRPESDSLRKIVFERADQPRLVFERTDAGDGGPAASEWRMVEPANARTESYLVDGLGRMVGGLVSQSTLRLGEKGLTAASAGLEPPRATLSVTDQDGKEFRLLIGKNVALSNDTYVRDPAKDEVHVVRRGFDTEIQRKADDYRAKQLFKLGRQKLSKVELEYDGRTYAIQRAGEDWVIDSPVKAYADTARMQALVTAFGGVSVKEFIEDAPESLDKYGLAKPYLSVRLTTQLETKPDPADSQPADSQPQIEEKHYTLLVGDYSEMDRKARYIKLADEPWVASATEEALDKLIPKLAEWRDSRVTRIPPGSETQIELHVGDAQTTLRRDGNVWRGVGDIADADQEAVRGLVTLIEDLRALDYVESPENLGAYGLDAPKAELRVTTAGAVEPFVLRIGGPTSSGRNTYAQVGGQTGLVVISAAQAERLMPHPMSLRSKVITDFPIDRLSRMTVQRGEQQIELTRGDAKWRITAPIAAPVDDASVRELTNTVVRLRARELAGKDDFASFGLDHPAITVQFVLDPPAPTSAPASSSAPAEEPAAEAETHTLAFGRARNKTFARLDDQPYIHELDETHWPVLSGELIQRKLFDFRGDQILGVHIQAPGGTLDFARKDGTWSFAPEPYVKLSQKALKQLCDDLAAMRVESYLAYQDGDLAAAGLEEAPVTVTLAVAPGAGETGAAEPATQATTITLKCDQVERGELPRKAAWVEQKRIFLLRPADIERLMRGLDAYVMPEGGEPEDDSAPPAEPSPFVPPG